MILPGIFSSKIVYTKIVGYLDISFCRCLTCQKNYKVGQGNTSTLWRHATRYHKSTLQEARDKAVSTQPTLFDVVQKKTDYYKSDFPRKRELDAALVRMISQDLQPLSVVEDKGFTNFCRLLDKKYKMPTRIHLRQVLLPEAFNKIQRKLKETLTQVEAACLTTDLWTSTSNSSFMAITVHYWDEREECLSAAVLDCHRVQGRHTADLIRDEMKRILDDFNISNKVLAVITDNASNVKKAIKEMDLRRLSCYAHCLNLTVLDSIKAIPSLQELRDKVSRIVKLTRQSTVAKETLDKIQVEMGKKPKRLVQDVVTRWNSLYLMLERFLELRDAISILLTKPGMDQDMSPLGAGEWGMIEETVQLLQPCFEATVELSAEKTPTGSKAIPMSRVLMAQYASSEREAPEGSFAKRLSRIILHNLNERFGIFEEVRILAVATLLDPRFKGRGFRLEEKKKVAIMQLTKELKDIHVKEDPVQDAAPPPAKRSNKGSIWDKFDSGKNNFLQL